VAFKGSAELNPETGIKRHLRALDVFSRLLVHPKCICSQGSGQNPAGEAYSTPPNPLAGGEGARQISGTSIGSMTVSNQNCYKWFRFKEKFEKH